MLITLYRTNDAGRIDYYTITDRQGHLFASYSLTVSWGRALSAGREKSYVFETRPQMDAKLRQLIRNRVSRGYRVLYTFFRNHDYDHLRPALRRVSVS